MLVWTDVSTDARVQREATAVRSEVERGLERFKDDSGYDLPGTCINVLAR